MCLALKREEVGDPLLPFMCGELGYFLASHLAHAQLVNTGTRLVASESAMWQIFLCFHTGGMALNERKGKDRQLSKLATPNQAFKEIKK